MGSRRERAELPNAREMRRATLEAMRGLPLPAVNTEIDEAVADTLRLSEQQRAVMHGRGSQTELAYRAAWARTSLKAVGAATNPRRALWTLTSDGETITAEEVERRYQESLAGSAASRTASREVELDDEDIEAAELDWQERLLDRLGAMPPSSFEQLVGRLLAAAGFHDVETLGQSGDGGIDGVGMYRLSLVSFPTYFQCKRWKSPVTSGIVRDFRGAMAGRGDRGLLITTSSFTRDARMEARRDGAAPIELIDGTALCELLKEYRLGVDVKERVVEDVTVNEAFFVRFERGYR